MQNAQNRILNTELAAAQLVSVKPEELKKMIHDGKVTDGFTMTALMMYLAKKTN